MLQRNPLGSRNLRACCLQVVVGGLLAAACGGERDLPAGEITGDARPGRAIAEQSRALGRARADLDALAAERDAASAEQILFGDLHVHTQYSIDAFLYALPIFGGSGAHPPADACDFARHCSSVDFFSLNDHAEGLTPERWARSLESLRQCNARAGSRDNPDLVAFAGWEWTQVGSTPDDHFGHKNVIFPGLAPDELPTRPINALPRDVMSRARMMWLVSAAQGLGRFGFEPYADFLWWIERLAEVPVCPDGVDTRELPTDCRESAETPEVLFEKLEQWGFETLVIPHGLAWGIHAPPGASLVKQLRPGRVAPRFQRLLEVYSGHGNSERYLETLQQQRGADGAASCPAPTEDSLACCWRAGELVRARCGAIPEAECEARVVEARQLALEAGSRPHWVLPDAKTEDWLDCDQCRDCFKPAMSLRPRMSAQFGLALSGVASDGSPDSPPRRFRYGLIGSSDDHKAQPGTGYKQIGRLRVSDARGLRSESLASWLSPLINGSPEHPDRAKAAPSSPPGFRNLFDVERSASFLYPGGLVAVHSRGRDRRSIWDALVARRVYGTSGPRILLWFELLNGAQPGGGAAVPLVEPMPMGSETELAWNPRFEVRAVGAFEQKPGCPPDTGLSAERIETLCGGECYHPSDRRYEIAAIEIVRIRPQLAANEEIGALIEDPWKRIACPPDPRGCIVHFDDPEFLASGRDAVYYARALQEETPAINGAGLRAVVGAKGVVETVEPCFAGWRGDASDDCLAPVQERAWSSPIFVDRASDAAR